MERIAAGLASLNTGATVTFEKTMRRGIAAATKFKVVGGEGRGHRNLKQILQMIGRADLPDLVKEDASNVFRRLGDAEAAVLSSPHALRSRFSESIGFIAHPSTLAREQLREHGLLAVPHPQRRACFVTGPSSGYGAGDMDFPEHANVLRAIIGEDTLAFSWR